MDHASSKSLCDALVFLSKIFICLSVTISLIRREGGAGGRREEAEAPEREKEKKDGEVLSTSLSHNPSPHRHLGL